MKKISPEWALLRKKTQKKYKKKYSISGKNMGLNKREK
jgi:hypothetical protein